MGDPATPSQIPVTEISQTLVMRLYENRGDSHMGNHSGYADDAEKFNSGVYREAYALAYAESIGVASGGVLFERVQRYRHCKLLAPRIHQLGLCSHCIKQCSISINYRCAQCTNFQNKSRISR